MKAAVGSLCSGLRELALDPAGTLRRVTQSRLCRHRLSNLRRCDRLRPSYAKSEGVTASLLQSLGQQGDSDIKVPCPQRVADTVPLYLKHRFDTLGSGWVEVKHGLRCPGIEGHRYAYGPFVTPDRDGGWLETLINETNQEESQRIWSLVDEGYTPIDWQLDFKSGYRWREETWYRDIEYAPVPGADIKVPWELGRMQHLVQLAWAYSLAGSGTPGFESPETCAREFRNQLLDFIATNPPRFGVHWQSTMEVGIRVANWLVAYDLFRSFGALFDPPFEEVFWRSVYEHAWHIVHHLEWFRELRSNHYLANIAGLLFASAYLPRSAETDAWLAFSVQELHEEVLLQFHPDGTNFEASTCYHRLSAEMVAYATALVLGLPLEKRKALREYDHRVPLAPGRLRAPPLPFYPRTDSEERCPFSPEYFHRLEGMAEFTMNLTKPNGQVVQIGDNDSGRFLKIQPRYRLLSAREAKDTYDNLRECTALDDPDARGFLVEDHLNHRHLVGAINGLFRRDDFASFAGEDCLDSAVVSALARGACLAARGRRGSRDLPHSEDDWDQLVSKLSGLPADQLEGIDIPLPLDLDSGDVSRCAHPEFGVYVIRAPHFFLSIRCGPVGQNGNGGHAHNDQLSVELNVKGVDWIRDPGTYLYTPFPEIRNRYRSVQAHFAPGVAGREPSDLSKGLFQLRDDPRAECLYFGKNGFAGRHRGYEHPVYRVVELGKSKIRILDASPGLKLAKHGASEATGGDPQKLCRALTRGAPPFSPGYGVVFTCRDGQEAPVQRDSKEPLQK